MNNKSLADVCFDLLSRKISLQQVPGFDELESIKLLSGEDGGAIKLFTGEKIKRVNLVDFTFGDGVIVPHHDNRVSIGSELFQVSPDFGYKLPIWGINNIKFKDGTYYFDTDFSFGFDLVMDHGFTMKYLDPFNELYKKYSAHPDLTMVPLSEMPTWVRTYVSPVFIAATTTIEKCAVVHELVGDLIGLWLNMYRDAGERNASLEGPQQQRIMAQYSGMKNTDRMGKILMEIYGPETFGKFFKAMTA